MTHNFIAWSYEINQSQFNFCMQKITASLFWRKIKHMLFWFRANLLSNHSNSHLMFTGMLWNHTPWPAAAYSTTRQLIRTSNQSWLGVRSMQGHKITTILLTTPVCATHGYLNRCSESHTLIRDQWSLSVSRGRSSESGRQCEEVQREWHGVIRWKGWRQAS